MDKPDDYFRGIPEYLRALLEFPYEGQSIDYKESFSFNDAGFDVRAGLFKDIAALANSGGGRILIGVQDGTFRIDENIPEDHGFEVTKVGDQIRKYFEPHPRCTILCHPVRPKPRIIEIVVEEFAREPVVCCKGSGEIAQAELYVRTADGKSKRVDRLEEMQALLRISAKKIRAEAVEVVSAIQPFEDAEVENFVHAARLAWEKRGGRS